MPVRGPGERAPTLRATPALQSNDAVATRVAPGGIPLPAPSSSHGNRHKPECRPYAGSPSNKEQQRMFIGKWDNPDKPDVPPCPNGKAHAVPQAVRARMTDQLLPGGARIVVTAWSTHSPLPLGAGPFPKRVSQGCVRCQSHRFQGPSPHKLHSSSVLAARPRPEKRAGFAWPRTPRDARTALPCATMTLATVNWCQWPGWRRRQGSERTRT